MHVLIQADRNVRMHWRRLLMHELRNDGVPQERKSKFIRRSPINCLLNVHSYPLASGINGTSRILLPLTSRPDYGPTSIRFTSYFVTINGRKHASNLEDEFNDSNGLNVIENYDTYVRNAYGTSSTAFSRFSLPSASTKYCNANLVNLDPLRIREKRSIYQASLSLKETNKRWFTAVPPAPLVHNTSK